MYKYFTQLEELNKIEKESSGYLNYFKFLSRLIDQIGIIKKEIDSFKSEFDEFSGYIGRLVLETEMEIQKKIREKINKSTNDLENELGSAKLENWSRDRILGLLNKAATIRYDVEKDTEIQKKGVSEQINKVKSIFRKIRYDLFKIEKIKNKIWWIRISLILIRLFPYFIIIFIGVIRTCFFGELGIGIFWGWLLVLIFIIIAFNSISVHLTNLYVDKIVKMKIQFVFDELEEILSNFILRRSSINLNYIIILSVLIKRYEIPTEMLRKSIDKIGKDIEENSESKELFFIKDLWKEFRRNI